jgi:Holliday junction resolvasome RuvABC endonuclease subunit
MNHVHRVVGVDLSLTGTGLADVAHEPSGALTYDYRTVTSKPAGQDVRARSRRIDDVRGEVLRYARGSDLVIVEGPSLGKASPHTWDRAWLWGSVVDDLLAARLAVAVAPPTVVKKFAAGKGNADKTAVAVGMARLWGEGTECRNDNEWDALALATMGAQRIGIPDIPERAHHAGTLASVAWPTAGE